MHYTFANICSDRFYGNGRTDGMSWKSAGLLFSAGRKKYKAECNGHIRQNNPCGLENVRKEIGGGREREMPVSEAFRCHGANLLPFTKFIGKGLFIK